MVGVEPDSCPLCHESRKAWCGPSGKHIAHLPGISLGGTQKQANELCIGQDRTSRSRVVLNPTDTALSPALPAFANLAVCHTQNSGDISAVHPAAAEQNCRRSHRSGALIAPLEELLQFSLFRLGEFDPGLRRHPSVIPRCALPLPRSRNELI